MSESPTVIARARVAWVERPCPTFARVAFRGPELEWFGTPGRTFDQRIKVIFPPHAGDLPDLAPDTWYPEWLELPEEARGAMRTYSIRDVCVDATGTEVVVDFVLHLAPGTSGPAALWASGARAGDEVLLVGPRRGRLDGGGIEFDPGAAPRVLLAGDETAAPAIARILEDAPHDLVGDAFIEMPGDGERLDIRAPRGVELRWLSRFSEAPGSALVPSVLASLGTSAAALEGYGQRGVGSSVEGLTGAGEPAGDELLWETPSFSGLGEPLDAARERGERYYWIAGESSVVTRLRRHLVRDLGVSRHQVAFMGYWREGVAMR
ncbi:MULTISPECIES: siderophore-interacting protein [unclassified Leucobacter]|uniref:siderophore-interacting protein n=1 Tax=unclassified Leucobacter TaxID=2621730 RepID=UPI00165D55C4|nr:MULTISPECIES: siderophore-interacting protein [unclassified Leucobacter]MBC9937470.1 siderophore-interacting protein [Leucobacter sp. cx-87]